MENGNAFTCVCARSHAIISFIALCIVATIVLYNTYFVLPSPVPNVGRQQCSWSKTKTKVPRCSETPPWLLLLADYEGATVSGRNLYVWPWINAYVRLGNRLFAYATLFGIAWRNRRIPIWRENSAKEEFNITEFFNLRVPSDQNETIMRVSLILYSSLAVLIAITRFYLFLRKETVLCVVYGLLTAYCYG